MNLDPCLARVQREQKAAAEAARFGAHFTRIVRYSVLRTDQRQVAVDQVENRRGLARRGKGRAGCGPSESSLLFIFLPPNPAFKYLFSSPTQALKRSRTRRVATRAPHHDHRHRHAAGVRAVAGGGTRPCTTRRRRPRTRPSRDETRAPIPIVARLYFPPPRDEPRRARV